MKKALNSLVRRGRAKKLTKKKKLIIAKKTKAKAKNLKKDQRKHPERYHHKLKKDHIPSQCPFKEKLILDAQKSKQLEEESRQKRREELKELRKEKRAEKFTEKRGLGDLVASAELRTKQFDARCQAQLELRKSGIAEKSAKAFYKEFQKVVNEADVILEVLDARDPLGTRCSQVEKAVLESGTTKRLVLVVNKADLVPKENLESWLKYLRGEFPSVAFKASTQTGGVISQQKRKIVSKKAPVEIQTSRCLGADVLVGLLKNYCRNSDIKTSIRVGIVGLPNVGKSSIINSLKRNKACNVGATPGVTKVRQEVHLDSQIILLDSPGMVLAAGNDGDANIALRNAVRIQDLLDYTLPVEAILRRTTTEQMMTLYKIGSYTSPRDFLVLLAQRFGRLRKGGVPNTEAAARQLLQDWNSGRIKYHTEPPECHSGEVHVGAELVQQMAAEFDINSLQSEEQSDIQLLPYVNPSNSMEVTSAGILHEAQMTEVDDDGEEAMEEDSSTELLSNVVIDMPSDAKMKSHSKISDKKVVHMEAVPEGNLQLKKKMKQQLKKAKKQKARKERLETDLSENLDSAMKTLGAAESDDEDEDYDFRTDFTM